MKLASGSWYHFCFVSPLSQIALLEGTTSSFFCQSFMRRGKLVNHSLMPPQNCHASYDDSFPHLCLEVSTNSSNLALTFNWHRFQLSSIQISLSISPTVALPSYMNFFITWIVFRIIKLDGLKTCKLWTLSCKLSTNACTYIAPTILHSSSVSSRSIFVHDA